MARYPLNLPAELKQEAEQIAERQGVSLNQFVLWAVAEKVGSLKQSLDDPRFPHVTYRVGAGGMPTPVIRGTNLRVQTIAIAAHSWNMTVSQVAADYDLAEGQGPRRLGLLCGSPRADRCQYPSRRSARGCSCPALSCTLTRTRQTRSYGAPYSSEGMM